MMLEIGDFSLGTPFQGATFATVIVAFLTYLGLRFKHGPDHTRAENERDSSLRGDLLNRIAVLEDNQISDRAEHAEARSKDRAACDAVTDELRQRIREQDKIIDGLQRHLIMFQVASGRALPLGEQSPEMEAMITSLSSIYGLKDTPDSETMKAAKETRHAADVTVEQIKQDEATERVNKAEDEKK